MRAIIPAVIIGILVIGGLIALAMIRSSHRQSEALSLAHQKQDAYQIAYVKIRREISVQSDARISQIGPIADIMTELDTDISKFQKEHGIR